MDFNSDNNPSGLVFLSNKLNNPLLKVANNEDLDTLPDHAFADYFNREYPINSGENVCKSYAYLLTNGREHIKQANKFNHIKETIEIAAYTHGVEEVLADIESSLIDDDSIKKANEAEDKFALVINYGDKNNSDIRYFYPMRNSNEVVDSTIKLANEKWKLPIEWYKDAATKLVKKAKECNISENRIPNDILKIGSSNKPDFEFAELVAKRREEDYPENGSIYIDIVKSARDDSENLDEYINLFIELDRVNGINQYNDNFIDPYTTFNSGSDSAILEKQANETVLFNDILIPLDEFQNLSDNKLAKGFSKQASEKILNIINENNNALDLGLALENELDADYHDRLLNLLINET